MIRELLRIGRVLGWGQLMRINRARRLGGDTLIRGYFATPTLIALLNVGFFDALAGEREVDIKAFAKEQGLEPAVLQALCDYLYAMQVLDRNGRGYKLARNGRLLVDMVSGSLYSAGAYAPVFCNLEDMLRGTKRYGEDVRRDPALAARGSGDAGKLFMFPMVSDLLHKRGITGVLDLGCGDAAFLIGLCKANPAITAYGIDISPEAIEDGKRNAATAGLQDRIHLYAEDMFKLQSIAGELDGVGAATSFFVMHEFLACGDERILDFFKSYREALPGVPLIVCESARHTPEQLRKRPGPLMDFQLVHDLSGQRPVSREEWRAIFGKAGFTSIGEDYFRLGRMVIFTVS